MVYYPAQYIPADEVLVRVPRQLGQQGPLRPVRQSDFAADQEASADTAYGAAPVSCNIPHLKHSASKKIEQHLIFLKAFRPFPEETYFLFLLTNSSIGYGWIEDIRNVKWKQFHCLATTRETGMYYLDCSY